MCSQDNGGCARHAQCTQVGVNVSCSCAPGYGGDGYVCDPIDRCADGRNGDCSQHANCISTGPVSTCPRSGEICMPGRTPQVAAVGCFRLLEDSDVTVSPVTAVPRPAPPHWSPQLLRSSCRSLLPGRGHALGLLPGCGDGPGDVMLRPFFPIPLSKGHNLCQLWYFWTVLGALGWSFKDNASHFCRGTRAAHCRPEDGTGSMMECKNHEPRTSKLSCLSNSA